LGLSDLSRGDVSAGEPARLSATILVYLPADAKLTIDGDATSSTSETRRFVTPPLPRDGNYYYTFRAEFEQEGKTVTVSKDVVVRAGRQTTVSLYPPERQTTVSFYPPEQTNGDTPGISVSRALNFRPEPFNPRVPELRRNGVPPPVRSSPFSEQSPMNGAGPPGSNNPMSMGVGQG
jgi:uncharacterized protein (TIGR03000 family)